jgi:exopolyphosphatase / guanosine-5'-triphosphate,3'-diphosphate pyrophosphatase
VPVRLAAIDIGTNTVLLTVAEPDAGRLVPLVERASITRLGQGVDAAGRLSDAAQARTLAVLEAHAREIIELRVDAVACVCTSAARDARNGAAFLAEARRVLGRDVAILSGSEEASLAFEGALSGLDLRGRVSVLDVGGGSTEIIHGRVDVPPRAEAATSLDIGSVRLTERHVRTDPPTAQALDAVRRDVETALASAPRAPDGTTWVGVAGTVTTLAAIEARLEAYDPNRVHGSTLSRSCIDALRDRLAALPVAERAALPGLEAGRADVIVAGSEIVSSILHWAHANDLVVSDRGVRWGLLQRLLATAGG